MILCLSFLPCNASWRPDCLCPSILAWEAWTGVWRDAAWLRLTEPIHGNPSEVYSRSEICYQEWDAGWALSHTSRPHYWLTASQLTPMYCRTLASLSRQYRHYSPLGSDSGGWELLTRAATQRPATFLRRKLKCDTKVSNLIWPDKKCFLHYTFWVTFQYFNVGQIRNSNLSVNVFFPVPDIRVMFALSYKTLPARIQHQKKTKLTHIEKIESPK